MVLDLISRHPSFLVRWVVDAEAQGRGLGRELDLGNPVENIFMVMDWMGSPGEGKSVERSRAPPVQPQKPEA